MKNGILIVLSIGAIVMSCEKEEVEGETISPSEITGNNRIASHGRQWVPWDPGYDEDGPGGDCLGPGIDCYFTQIVNSGSGVHSMLANEPIWLDNTAMISYVTVNESALSAFIDSALLTAVISGDLTIQKFGSLDETGAIVHLKYLDSSGNLFRVTPFQQGE